MKISKTDLVYSEFPWSWLQIATYYNFQFKTEVFNLRSGQVRNWI